MKKKVFRERYSNLEVYGEKIESPEPIKVTEEEPKKRGRKSVKSDK